MTRSSAVLTPKAQWNSHPWKYPTYNYGCYGKPCHSEQHRGRNPIPSKQPNCYWDCSFCQTFCEDDRRQELMEERCSLPQSAIQYSDTAYHGYRPNFTIGSSGVIGIPIHPESIWKQAKEVGKELLREPDMCVFTSMEGTRRQNWPVENAEAKANSWSVLNPRALYKIYFPETELGSVGRGPAQ